MKSISQAKTRNSSELTALLGALALGATMMSSCTEDSDPTTETDAGTHAEAGTGEPTGSDDDTGNQTDDDTGNQTDDDTANQTDDDTANQTDDDTANQTDDDTANQTDDDTVAEEAGAPDTNTLGDASVDPGTDPDAGATSDANTDSGSTTDSGPEPDASTDPGTLTSTGPSAEFDASTDLPDSSTDVALEAGTDAGTDASAGTPLRVISLEELADESALSYDDNEHGLIGGSRAQEWIEDWNDERPDGITGRLIILQVVPSGVTTEVHITADEANGVYSYLVPASDFNAPRNSGLSSFESDIPTGEAADAWLHKYAIDPREDFILLTFEDQASTTNAVVQSVGRAWIFLKYWGVAKEHVGILNGSVNWNAENEDLLLSDLADANFSVPSEDGTVTVRDLGVDATVSSISLEEIIAILNEEDGAPELAAVRIVDARGGAEALGLRKSTNTGRVDCTSYTGTAPNAKCSTPFEGRIKGARSVPWTQFLDTKENGFRFLPPASVKPLFDAQSNWDEDAEWGIHYCRTNQRSTVTGIVANVILGYPTRFYETSFIEWGHASTAPGIVGEDFPFRTDLEELTEHAVLHADDLALYTPGGSLGTLTQPVTWVAGPNYNLVADVSPPSAEPWPANAAGWPKIDPEATTTRLAIDTDRAYLRGISVDEID